MMNKKFSKENNINRKKDEEKTTLPATCLHLVFADFIFSHFVVLYVQRI